MEIMDEKEIELKTIPEDQRSGVTKVGRWWLMIFWAVGELCDRFCLARIEVIQPSFTTVGLSLLITSGRNIEISLKGIDMGKLVQDLTDWTVKGFE